MDWSNVEKVGIEAAELLSKGVALAEILQVIQENVTQETWENVQKEYAHAVQTWNIL